MSSAPFRFAVQGGPFEDPAALREHARLVESLGYDELYSMDHFGGAVDPFVPLLVAAEATTRVRVGPLVLNNEFHNPGLLARTAVSMDQMTGGRLVLGMGTGYARSEHDALGIELREPGPRVDRFAESLDALRALLDDGACTLHGDHIEIDVEEMPLRPMQERIPFVIGGNGRRVVGLAAKHADIFQFTGLTHDRSGALAPTDWDLPALDERARWLDEAAGTRGSEIERSSLVQFTAIGEDTDEEALTARFRNPIDVLERSPFVLFGSVAQVVDKLESVRERLGISHWVVREAEAFAPVVDALRGR